MSSTFVRPLSGPDDYDDLWRAALRREPADAIDQLIARAATEHVRSWDAYRDAMLAQATNRPHHWAHEHNWEAERATVISRAYATIPYCVNVHLPSFDLTPEIVETLLATSADT